MYIINKFKYLLLKNKTHNSIRHTSFVFNNTIKCAVLLKERRTGRLNNKKLSLLISQIEDVWKLGTVPDFRWSADGGEGGEKMERTTNLLYFCCTLKPMDWCAPRVIPTPRSLPPTISTSLAYWVLDRPSPPSSVGTCKANAPSSQRPFNVSESIFSKASFFAGSFWS